MSQITSTITETQKKFGICKISCSKMAFYTLLSMAVHAAQLTFMYYFGRPTPKITTSDYINVPI